VTPFATPDMLGQRIQEGFVANTTRLVAGARRRMQNLQGLTYWHNRCKTSLNPSRERRASRLLTAFENLPAGDKL